MQCTRARGVGDVPLVVPALQGQDDGAVAEDAAPHTLVDGDLGDAVIVQHFVAVADPVVLLRDLAAIQRPDAADAADERPRATRGKRAKEQHANTPEHHGEGLHQAGQGSDSPDDGEDAAWQPGCRMLGPLSWDGRTSSGHTGPLSLDVKV